MPVANIGAIVARAWDQAIALGAYGHAPMTVGYYTGRAYVKVWNYRTGNMDWRRLPSHDVPVGHEPRARRADPWSVPMTWKLN